MARIIVIGGGIAGLRIAKRLDATLVAKQSYFTFTPQVPDMINEGGRFCTKPLSLPNVVVGTVKRVDTEQHAVVLEDRTLYYDVLVVAIGAEPYLPVAGAKEHCIPFYTAKDAKELTERLPTRDIVIVGGGAVGVEVACEVARHAKSTTILQASQQILPAVPDRVRDYALSRLKLEGVRVRTSVRATKIEKDTVHTEKDSVPFDVCIWAGGMHSRTLDGLPKDKGILVDKHLLVKGTKNVFAAGDCAQSGNPMTAQAAQQEADLVVRNVRHMLKRKPLLTFKYKEKGRMLSLGPVGAVYTPHLWFHGIIGEWVRKLYYYWQSIRY